MQKDKRRAATERLDYAIGKLNESGAARKAKRSAGPKEFGRASSRADAARMGMEAAFQTDSYESRSKHKARRGKRMRSRR